jgi:hypothetical protein
VRTHLVDKLLEQHCYKSAAGLICYNLCVFTCVVIVAVVNIKVTITCIQDWELQIAVKVASCNMASHTDHQSLQGV